MTGPNEIHCIALPTVMLLYYHTDAAPNVNNKQCSQSIFQQHSQTAVKLSPSPQYFLVFQKGCHLTIMEKHTHGFSSDHSGHLLISENAF